MVAQNCPVFFLSFWLFFQVFQAWIWIIPLLFLCFFVVKKKITGSDLCFLLKPKKDRNCWLLKAKWRRSDNYFLILGDWGKAGGPGSCQLAVATRMRQYAMEQRNAGLFSGKKNNGKGWWLLGPFNGSGTVSEREDMLLGLMQGKRAKKYQ